MSQRLLNNTKWLWCLIALHAGSLWGQTRSVSVRSPPSNPATIEAQAKFFQDFFSVQLSPYKIEFGHVCEDPNTWEQRYEKKDFKNHRDMGKVRWGDKKGGYGEHYWDLNHVGNSGNQEHDGDDGSYHESNNNDPYDEHSDNLPTYGTEEYDPEKSSYEENGRAKRAHPKTKVERKYQRQSETYDEEVKPQKQKRKQKEEIESVEVQDDDEYEDEEEDDYVTPKPKRQKHRKQVDKEQQQFDNQEEIEQQSNQQQPKEKNQFVLVVSQKDDIEKQKQQYQPQYSTRQPESPQFVSNNQPELSQYLPKRQQELPQYVSNKQPELQPYVPYESGTGVKQYQLPEVSPATTVPRLFLEPSTGHVVDRATGQAYVLQPIAPPKNYN